MMTNTMTGLARTATLAALGIRHIPRARVRAFYLRDGRVFRDGERLGLPVVELVRCGRCGGVGTLPGLRHVDAGVCFRCSGDGVTGRVTKASRALEALLVSDDGNDWGAAFEVPKAAAAPVIVALRARR